MQLVVLESTPVVQSVVLQSTPHPMHSVVLESKPVVQSVVLQSTPVAGSPWHLIHRR